MHGDQPALLSSSSSKSGSTVDAQGGPQGVEQEEVLTIPVSAISMPTISMCQHHSSLPTLLLMMIGLVILIPLSSTLILSMGVTPMGF
jgi:hypothetical protein